jgi:hypothetical protein
MKHVLKDLQANLHGLVESLFKDYARQLRADYPKQTIRNSVVITSAVQEFARLGYIELVDVRLGIPADIPKRLVRTSSDPANSSTYALADFDRLAGPQPKLVIAVALATRPSRAFGVTVHAAPWPTPHGGLAAGSTRARRSIMSSSPKAGSSRWWQSMPMVTS